MLGALTAIIDSGRLTKRGGAWLLRGDLRDVGLAATGTVSRMHVASAGEWLGHPDGPFEFTQAVFDTMCANASAQSTPLSIDYDHRAWSDTAPDSRAAGWVQKLTREGEGEDAKLWATVEWTASAADAIRAGEFRFCSPAWTMDSIDRKSGEAIGPRMLNIALTNVPFLDGQTPITCTQRVREKTKMAAEDIKPEDEKKPEDETTAADDPTAALGALVKSVAEAAGVDELAAIAAMSEMSEAIGGMVRDQLNQDGMPSEVEATVASEATAAPAVVTASVKVGTDADAASIRLMSARIVKLEADLAKREAFDKAATAARIEADADKLIADGYALDSQRADVVFLMSTAPDRVASIFGTKVSPVGVTQAPVVVEGVAPDKFEASLKPEQRTFYASLPDDQRGFFKMLASNMPPDRAQARLIALREKNSNAS